MIRTRPPIPETEEGEVVDPTLSEATPSSLSLEARGRMESALGETVFLGDWSGMTFLHFEVEADRLAEVVPFTLDLCEGRAFVSLVAFTMRRFRLSRGGKATAWLTAPLATQRFLNLRTYVSGPHGAGIFFVHEWLDHALAVRLGPSTFGLPYRRGRLDYQNHTDAVSGSVFADGVEGRFSGNPAGPPRVAAAGSRDEFLLERYTAYTAAGFRPLAFRVWHEPWSFRTLETEQLTMMEFLRSLRQPWTNTLRFAGAACSEGVEDVWMGRPRFA